SLSPRRASLPPLPPAGWSGTGEPPPPDDPWHQPGGCRPVPARAPGPGVLQWGTAAFPAPAQPWPRRRHRGADDRRGHGPAGARVRGRHAPLRAGPGEGPYRRGGDAAGSRRPGAQGGGRLRRPRAARPAAAEPGAHLHEPQRAHGHRPGPVSRAAARRRARAAGGGALEARRAARACAARGLLRRAQHRRAVHGARVAAPPAGLNMELDEHLREGVIAVAHAAAAAILEVYERDFDVEQKSDDSPVTAADLAAHRCIVDGLARLTPDIPVLSEESTAIHMAQ